MMSLNEKHELPEESVQKNKSSDLFKRNSSIETKDKEETLF